MGVGVRVLLVVTWWCQQSAAVWRGSVIPRSDWYGTTPRPPPQCWCSAGRMQRLLLIGALPCMQGAETTRSRKVTGVLAAVSSSPTGQTTSKTLQLVIHASIVVSSCGAIHTPALLLRSGVTVGGNVGANLRLHPATGITGTFNRTPEQAAAGRGAVEMYKVSCAC